MIRTLDCLLLESSNQERLDCKVTWHMLVYWLQTTHEGQSDWPCICFLNLHSKEVYAIHMTLRCKVECMSHIGAMQGSMHAAGRLGDTVVLHMTQDAFFAQQNNSICSIYMLCSNILSSIFWTFRMLCLILCEGASTECCWHIADTHNKHLACYCFQHWNVCSACMHVHVARPSRTI